MDRVNRSEEGSRQGVGAMGRVKCSRKRRGREGGRRRRELQEEDKDNRVGFDPLVDLPLDIAQLIFDRMNFTARFSVPAVCRSWRELSANRLTPPPTVEQPWMLLRGVCCPTVRLVDLSMPTPLAHHRHCPPAIYGDHTNVCSQTDIVAGCHDQFLILSQIVPHFNCIFDPFSGKRRALPSRTRDGALELRIHRAKLSCAPTRGNVEAGRCLVAAMTYYEDDGRVFLCRPDSDYWTQILSPTEGGIRDMAFHRARLYAIDRNGIILVSTDLSDTRTKRSRTFLQVSLCIRSQVVLHQIPCQDMPPPEVYLVESCGELLLVQLRLSGWCEPGKVTFKVYKVVEKEVGSEERKLVPINDLGDEMLFVGKCCSRSWSGSASGFFLKNCIYFLWYAEGVGRFHLRGDDGNALLLPQVLEIPCEDGHSYRNALWITPPSHPITQI